MHVSRWQEKEFFFGPIAEMLFARVPPPIDFFYEKLTKAATKKVEKTIFVLRKK